MRGGTRASRLGAPDQFRCPDLIHGASPRQFGLVPIRADVTDPRPWWSPSDRIPRARVTHPRRPRVIATCVAAITVFGFAAAAFAAPSDQPRRTESSITYPVTMNALVASCDGLVRYDQQPAGAGIVGWLPDGSEFRYVYAPPVSGPYAKTTPAAGVYGPDSQIPSMGEAVSFLWHGGVVIWYKASLTAEQFQVLNEIVDRWPTRQKFLVLPWPVHKLPLWPVSGRGNSRNMIVTGWNMAQGCDVPSVDVLSEFEKALAETPAPGADRDWTDPGPQATTRSEGQSLDG